MNTPPPAHGAFFALNHRIVALSGGGAIAFAQAQTMNDLATLGDGQWQWNGWLTPKGRVIALFALLRRDPQTLWLVLPDAHPVAFVDALRRFVFRAKVTIDLRDDLHASGAFAAPRLAVAAISDAQEAGGVELDFSGEGGTRTLHLGTTPAADDADALVRWRTFDLSHGLPRLDPAQAGQWTPQQLSLERLRAFSVKKGCYPGQEIVARTHFLGQAKRGLVLLETAAPAAAGDAVLQGGATLGSVASIAAGAPPLALAVLPLERRAAALAIGGQAVTERPLLTGLAR